LDSKSANDAAEMTAALIDGFWLRCALSRDDTKHFEKATMQVLH
jgi:TetR/AcrR family transcriptional repressor of bet genes